MTQEEKRICAERLFDEIGLVDDRFITEAATPYRREGRAWLRRLIVAATSVTLVVCVGVGVFVAAMLAGDNEKSDGLDMNEELFADDMANGSASAAATLSVRLYSLKDETAELAISRAEVELFDNVPKVVWKYADEEEYRVRDITNAEAAELTRRLGADRGERVTDNGTAERLDGLWIATGDGIVISPYLEQTAGNVGFGELFEYEPEYEPSSEFSEYLCDVIS